MPAELVLAIAHLERMIRTHVPDNPSKQLALKEMETIEFQLAFAVSLRDVA